MPSANRQALLALQEAAGSFRRRQLLCTPLEAERQLLLEWIEARSDLRDPITPEELPAGYRATAGQRLLLPGHPEPRYVRLRGWGRPNPVWLTFDLEEGTTVTNPVKLLWDEDPATRKAACGAAALLRFAAQGDGPSLVWLLEHTGWPAAAALVRDHWDDDQLYELGSGAVPAHLPSPRRLLQACLRPYEHNLVWLAELCDGGVDWHDPDGRDQEVPRGEARLPGDSAPSAAGWIKKL